jgi:hypothetical protein
MVVHRSTDDPYSTGKLFEFLRDRYTEQLYKMSLKLPQGLSCCNRLICLVLFGITAS